MKKKFVNLTPHAIVLNSGEIFEPSGVVARVSSSIVEVGDGFFSQVMGEVIDLNAPIEGVYYIVSAMVKSATDRKDVVAPATGHKDCVRNSQGHIVSVPGFII